MATATPTRPRRGRAAAKAKDVPPKTTTRRSKPAAAAPPADDLIEDGGPKVRDPGTMHELFAEYLNETYGAGVTPEQVAMFTSKRNEFRRTETYLQYRAERAAGVAEASKPKAVAKATEEKPRRTRRNASTAAEEPKADGLPGKPVRRGRKPAAVKVNPEKKLAQAQADKPRTRRTRTSKPPAAPAAPVVEEETPAPAPATTEEPAAAKPTRRRRSSRPAAAAPSEAEPF